MMTTDEIEAACQLLREALEMEGARFRVSGSREIVETPGINPNFREYRPGQEIEAVFTVTGRLRQLVEQVQ